MKRFVFSVAFLALAAGAASAQDKWGTIKGRIVWGGPKAPEREDLTDLIMKNPDKEFCLKDGKVFDERWVVDPKTKGIQWTFVWLAPDDPKDTGAPPIHPKLKDLDKKEVVVDQPVCMYIPHAIGVREGQTLVCKNTAKVSHNILYVGPNDLSGNPLILPGKDLRLEGLKAHAFPVTLSCSIHTWMKAYVRVFAHPYFAVTAGDGTFTIPDAPAGKYRLMVWHGTGGYRGGAAGRTGQPITIEADKTTDLGNLIYPPPK